MPVTHLFKLHDDRVLWPEHKPESEVLELKATTPAGTWETTYQGNKAAPGGTIFKREWYTGRNRFYLGESAPVARWVSFDTASSEDQDAAYTAWVVADLLKDYRLAVIEAGRKRVEFPALLDLIRGVASRYYAPELLRGVLIEDKSSGISALQTLRQAASPPWLKALLVGFLPKVDKPTRYGQAAVWCSLGCVLLPWPGEPVPWLYEFEEELFAVPNAPELDQADALSQLVIYVENHLSMGYSARSRKQ